MFRSCCACLSPVGASSCSYNVNQGPYVAIYSAGSWAPSLNVQQFRLGSSQRNCVLIVIGSFYKALCRRGDQRPAIRLHPAPKFEAVCISKTQRAGNVYLDAPLESSPSTADRSRAQSSIHITTSDKRPFHSTELRNEPCPGFFFALISQLSR